MKDLKKSRENLLKELSTFTQVLHGSWVERYSVCSRENCKCKRGVKHGPRRYLVINVLTSVKTPQFHRNKIPK